MQVHGKCHCGAIELTAEIDPKHTFLCHCTDCQTMSGSAYRSLVRARADGFALVAGTPATYVKTGDSGAQRAQAFCPTCGTSLYSIPVEDAPKFYTLRTAILDERDQLPPRAQIWTRSAQEWSGNLETVRGFAGQFE
jgi:hypothetical protein